MKKIVLALAALLFSFAAHAQTQAHAAPAIHEFTTDSLGNIIANQKGHPFVLVIWSLDCEFCQSSLDTLSKKKHANKNLRIVTLGTDSMADEQAVSLMKKKLGTLGLSADAWAFGDTPPEQLRYALDKKWHGEMPRSYWFDAQGNSTARSGVITAENFDHLMAGK
ncbi:hypothetical protein [Undibacterium sp.]|uniref:hypothetical protein n=1 Tax=Undibacterium sp. TaxID=1914977 RepID=UPI00374D02C4